MVATSVMIATIKTNADAATPSANPRSYKLLNRVQYSLGPAIKRALVFSFFFRFGAQ